MAEMMDTPSAGKADARETASRLLDLTTRLERRTVAVRIALQGGRVTTDIHQGIDEIFRLAVRAQQLARINEFNLQEGTQ